MKRYSILFLFFSLVCIRLSAQQGRDETLANSYYQNGEIEKAAELYQSLWERNDYSLDFYAPLYKCLIQLKKYDELEKVVKREIKKYDSPQFVIDLGYLYAQIPDAGKAKEQYEKAIKDIKPAESAIRQLANSFEAYGLYDYAITVYDRGQKLIHADNYFNFEIAQVYLKKRDIPSAISFFLTSMDSRPQNAQPIKNLIQTSPDETSLLDEMELQLYSKVQKNPGNEDYIDLLTWVYIQNKDFEGALAQMKAIDRRKGENGFRVLDIARMAMLESDFSSAINGFQYVVDKGKNNGLYFTARTELLNCRKEKIAQGINYTIEDLQALKKDYLDFISDNSRSARTAQSMKELADLEGFYLHNIDTAIAICQEIISMPGVNLQIRNRTKLSLGDFYLINGDVWESTLLYSQVDKDERDSPLGEEARFRNAKLAYYKGDFEWAQTQLEALKGSTTELISNDAIDLSVFIIDNLGLDTTEVPMQMYARAELLLYQNRNLEAVAILDSILKEFPGHVLFDDIEYTKANIYIRQKEFEKAIPLLQDIIINYKLDLKGDDATFLLAKIYDEQMHNPEKAMELYKSVITDFGSSLLVIEARKRFRQLRGDKLGD